MHRMFLDVVLFFIGLYFLSVLFVEEIPEEIPEYFYFAGHYLKFYKEVNLFFFDNKVNAALLDLVASAKI